MEYAAYYRFSIAKNSLEQIEDLSIESFQKSIEDYILHFSQNRFQVSAVNEMKISKHIHAKEALEMNQGKMGNLSAIVFLDTPQKQEARTKDYIFQVSHDATLNYTYSKYQNESLFENIKEGDYFLFPRWCQYIIYPVSRDYPYLAIDFDITLREVE